MAEWHEGFRFWSSLTISVNVSARQLSDSRLVEDVQFALAESGLNPESLALEMTESSIMGNPRADAGFSEPPEGDEHPARK